MSKKIKPFETWVIRNKETGEYFVAPSGKNAWKKKAHAKNAWASIGAGYWWDGKGDITEVLARYGVQQTMYKLRPAFPYFDEQDVWECIELEQSVESVGIKLKRAEDFLRKIQGCRYEPETVYILVERYFSE